jgi:hypothetical protein
LGMTNLSMQVIRVLLSAVFITRIGNQRWMGINGFIKKSSFVS